MVQGTLISADGSLYAIGNTSTLDRINPATGTVVASVPYNMPVWNPPVVVGNTVWVVSSYNGGNIVLQGYDARTLARTSSLLVPAIGAVSIGGQGVLTSGPDGDLYVAAGETVAVVNPAIPQEIHRIQVLAGKTSSVAVSPDGSKLYVGTGSSTSFRLVVFNLPSDTIANESTLTSGGAGGNLVATSGGVWGTTGSGHSEWVWFAPNGNLARAVRSAPGAGGGLSSFPSYSGGVVWVGGTGDVVCASPATGQVLATGGHPGRPWRRPVLRQSRGIRRPGLFVLPDRRVAADRPGPHDAARRLHRQRQLLESGLAATLSSGGGGPGGVPSPNGRPPSSSRWCGVVQPDRSGPAGTIFDGFRPVCTL